MKSYSSIFKEKQILPYIMLGDGGFDQSKKLLDMYVEHGTEIIELGIPFSDPSADGPIIQAAGQRAINNDYTLSQCLAFINDSKSRYPDVKLVLMTYLNPILNYGPDAFFSTCKPHGVIIPDLPLEEYDIILPFLEKHEVPIIPLITIDTDIKRVQSIIRHSHAFIYMVSLKGTTGNKSADLSSTQDLLHNIRHITNIPIVAGFGIKTSDQIKNFLKIYDGVVIASQLIKLHQLGHDQKVIELLSTKKAVI